MDQRPTLQTLTSVAPTIACIYWLRPTSACRNLFPKSTTSSTKSSPSLQLWFDRRRICIAVVHNNQTHFRKEFRFVSTECCFVLVCRLSSIGGFVTSRNQSSSPLSHAFFIILCRLQTHSRQCSRIRIRGLIQDFAKGGPLPPAPSPSFLSPFPFPFPSPSLPLPLDPGPLKLARGSGERYKLPQSSPSGVRGGAPAGNEFSALQSCQKATGGNHFEYSEYHVLQ